MMKANHSDIEEEEDMATLELSSDSIEIATKKRPRMIDSEDEDKDMLAKKQRNSSDNKTEILEKNNIEILNGNGIDEQVKEKKHVENGKDLDKKDLSDTNTNKENDKKQENELTKQENENESSLEDKDDSTMDESSIKINIKEKNTENKNNTPKESVTNKDTSATSDCEKVEEENDDVIKKEVDNVDNKENNEEDGTKKKRVKNRTIDTEVVDGLELSVECASDKEESSSESTDEKDKKPRPKTIIVKAEPNESELECSSSEDEKSDTQEPTDSIETKPDKKRGKKRGGPRTSFNKLKASGSEDSHNNSDEDYSPRTKKKMKRSPTTKRSTKRTTESKRGRTGARKNSYKKNTENVSGDENVDTTSPNKTNKTKIKDEEEELSEKESLASKSGSNSNSDDEEKSAKGRKKKHNNGKPENKHIMSLKKYLRAAGVKVKSYNDIWADCKSNAAKISRLKELLEKNGVSGRPSLEKCKRVKEEKEKMREISELDTSNIISEGRITRARRHMEKNKKTNLDTSPRHREARSTFKRIQTVVDSDSE